LGGLAASFFGVGRGGGGGGAGALPAPPRAAGQWLGNMFGVGT